MCSFERIEGNKKDILNNITIKMVVMIDKGFTAGSGFTAAPSIESFFKTIDFIKSAFASSNECWDELCMKSVDLKCDGRKSCYDLMWFPSTNKIYAMDSSDDSYVYEVKQ
jgi:hypothetical protein